MENYLEYSKFLNEQKRVLETAMESAKNIDRVFITSFDGSELGHSDYSGTSITKGMAKAIDDFESADKLHDKDVNHEIIVVHWKRIFRSIREFQRTIKLEIPSAIKKVEKAKNSSLIPIRDYQDYPEYTRLAVAIANNGGSASLEELAIKFPYMATTLEDSLEKIMSLWKGLIQKEPVSGRYYMNEFEKNQLQTVTNADHSKIEMPNRMYDEISTKLAMYLYACVYGLKQPMVQQFINEEWSRYMNKPLGEFNGLVSDYYVQKLSEKNIRTGVDFLKAEYEFLRDRVKITKKDLINISLGLCSRLKFYVMNLSIRVIHKSAFKYKKDSSIKNAVRDLIDHYSEGRELKYKDILDKKEILINHKNVHSIENCYMLIAFVRWFYKRCTEGLPFRFSPLGDEYNFRSFLTKDEKYCLDKKYENIDINRVRASFADRIQLAEKPETDTYIPTQELDELENMIKNDEQNVKLETNGGTQTEEKVDENEEK